MHIAFTRTCVLTASLLALSSCTSTTNDHRDSMSSNAIGSDEMPLPPGVSKSDWDAWMAASVPGDMHALLAKSAGEWEGTSTMWMSPDAPPMKSELSMKCTPVFGGRFVQCEMDGEMEGMESKGVGFYGFDNVSQKLVATWMCDQSTGIMNGTGERSADGKTITWTYEYTCPIRKGPAKMRDVERTTGADTKTIETWATDPASGREFKMVQIDLRRD